MPKHFLCVQKGLSCGGVEKQNGIRSAQAQRSSMQLRCLYSQALPPSVSVSPSEHVTLLNQLVAISSEDFVFSDLDSLSWSNSVVLFP